MAFILIVSLVFVTLPGIDVWVSGLFAAPNKGGFPVARLPAFQILRDANRWLTWIIPIALIVVMIVKLVRPDRPSLVPPAKSFFLLLTLAVGSGIIANLIFKNNWGRPRPVRRRSLRRHAAVRSGLAADRLLRRQLLVHFG